MFRSIQENVGRTLQSVRSYADLRPDFRLRSRINRTLLRHRPSMTAEIWFERFWRQRGVTLPVVCFVHRYLSDYSGLWWDRIVPSDRLQEDLHLSLVCWFDWEMTLLNDLSQEFELAIEDLDHLAERLAEAVTVEDFLRLIDQQFVQMA